MEIIIHIYFYTNVFLTGYEIGSNFRWADDSNISNIFAILFVLLFGGIYYTVIMVKEALTSLFSLFQIQFFFSFYFGKKWDVLTKEEFDRMIRFKGVKGKGLRGKMWDLTINMAEKRYNKKTK